MWLSNLVRYGSLAAPAPHHPFHANVQWKLDEEWYWDEVTRGCCPAAVKVNTEANPHQSLLKKLEYRCCPRQYSQIRPLKPHGGVTWKAAAPLLANRTLVFTGDSITEQHFVAMLCLAWAEGFATELHTALIDPTHAYVPWVGTVTHSNTRLIFMRNHEATLLPVERKVSELGAILIRGGWQQAWPTEATVAAYGAMPGMVLLVEALPAHFPGGRHLDRQPYPKPSGLNGAAAAAGQMCSISAEPTNGTVTPLKLPAKGRPWDVMLHSEANAHVNSVLRTQAATHRRVHVLRAAEAYTSRGDAHVGSITRMMPGEGERRDCLHWCHAPGVTDALGLTTLAALASVAARSPTDDRPDHGPLSRAAQEAIEAAFRAKADLLPMK